MYAGNKTYHPWCVVRCAPVTGMRHHAPGKCGAMRAGRDVWVEARRETQRGREETVCGSGHVGADERVK